MLTTDVCCACGVAFEYDYRGQGRRRKFCGPACKRRQHRLKYAKHPLPVSAECLTCGVVFDSTGAGAKGKPKSFCSATCRRKSYYQYTPKCSIGYADCAECGALYILRRSPREGEVPVCRAAPCRRAVANRQMRAWFQRYRAENGEAYTNRYRDKRKAYMRQRINAKASLPFEEFTDVERFSSGTAGSVSCAVTRSTVI